MMRNQQRKFHTRMFAVTCGLIISGMAPSPLQAAPAWPPTAAHLGDRYVDAPDLKPLLAKFLTPQGFLYPAYPVTVAKPSRFLTDFYGVQALADRTAAQIKSDFTPRYATVAGEDAHSLTLRFKAGYTVRFYPHAALSVVGIVDPVDHAYVSGATWREMRSNLDDFLAVVRRAGLERAYLIPNPELETERHVAARLTSGVKTPPIFADPQLERFEAAPDAVLLAGEGVHGIPTSYEALSAELKTHHFDWLGMEMLPQQMQPVLDDFTRAPQDSERYRKARQAVLDYFAVSWNGRAGPKTTAEENYYFKLVDLAQP